MKEFNETIAVNESNNATGISIFDDLKPMPVYYSEKSVLWLSTVFGAFFGSVLMAINFKHTEGQKGRWQIIVFGIVYTCLQVLIANSVPRANSGIGFFLNLAAAYLMTKVFWKKYIGEGVTYARRSIVVPIVVGIAIMGFFLAAVLLAPPGS